MFQTRSEARVSDSSSRGIPSTGQGLCELEFEQESCPDMAAHLCSTSAPPVVRILLVERDHETAVLFRIALAQANLSFTLEVVGHGSGLISRLTAPKNRCRTDLVLLDVTSIPGGWDLLPWIRALNPGAPIVVFGPVGASVGEAARSANGSFPLPRDLDGFLRMGLDLRELWQGVLCDDSSTGVHLARVDGHRPHSPRGRRALVPSQERTP